jgi:hypothetical protein
MKSEKWNRFLHSKISEARVFYYFGSGYDIHNQYKCAFGMGKTEMLHSV